MIKFNNIDVYNFENAFRGMRNPLESWESSDSIWAKNAPILNGKDSIGKEDLELAQKLILAGPDHRKFMRQIFVSIDITAPLYFWKEADTYKVATTANSCSTMHKLATTPITKECFSFEHVTEDYRCWHCNSNVELIEMLCGVMENYRKRYLETKDKHYWYALIQLLPSSWNQMRTWTGSYETLRNIYFARKGHKLDEWREFCSMILMLPYAKELICLEKENHAT